jgi:hypothetical protein
MNPPEWIKKIIKVVQSPIGQLILFCISIMFVAFLICAKNWVENTTDEYLSNILKRDDLTQTVLNSLDKNLVGSTVHAHFFLGRKEDSPQYSLPFYVSSNQQVELQIKATHYSTNDEALRDVQVIVGSIVDVIKISSSTEYKTGLDITNHVKKAMSESPYDFSRNIQKVEFRLDPTQKTSSYVYIEALVITKGIPRMYRESSE